MKTIVVPTDFSAISLNAVNYAADLASVIKIDLSIVHVFSVPVIFNEIPVQEYNNKKIYEDAQERMAALERKIENRTKGKTKINTLLKQGDIVSSIDDYCKSVNVYAVVMGAESGHAFCLVQKQWRL